MTRNRYCWRKSCSGRTRWARAGCRGWALLEEEQRPAQHPGPAPSAQCPAPRPAPRPSSHPCSQALSQALSQAGRLSSSEGEQPAPAERVAKLLASSALLPLSSPQLWQQQGEECVSLWRFHPFDPSQAITWRWGFCLAYVSVF